MNLRTERAKLGIPNCPYCDSKHYFYDRITGAPTHCAQCGKNATHISKELVAKAKALVEIASKKKESSGIPQCPSCKQHHWEFNLEVKDGPFITYCGSCGKNWPFPQNTRDNIKIIAAQLGLTPKELEERISYTGKNAPWMPTLRVAKPVRNPLPGEQFVLPEENYITETATAVVEDTSVEEVESEELDAHTQEILSEEEAVEAAAKEAELEEQRQKEEDARLAEMARIKEERTKEQIERNKQETREKLEARKSKSRAEHDPLPESDDEADTEGLL